MPRRREFNGLVSAAMPALASLGTILSLGLLLAAPAGAQRAGYTFGAPDRGLPGTGEYGPGILTAEQAEACLRRWQELSTAQEALERDQARLDQLEAELYAPPQRGAPARGAAAPSRRGGQAQTPAAPAVSPEQAAAERQAKFETANALRRRYLDSTERHRAQIETFNAGCATRLYYEADMQAARERLGLSRQ